MVLNVKPHSLFPGIYWVQLQDGNQKLGTRNLVPGKKVYGERLVKFKSEEYRLWDPYRSKFAAAITRGLEKVCIRPTQKILYLGAASGTTASHVSDIVGEEGHVYCIEFASRPFRELVNNVCLFRSNMSPILADARMPEQYSMLVQEVHNIYCDVAQPEQAKIIADNANFFLTQGGWIMLAIKAQSIDVTKKPSEIYKKEVRTLKARGFEVKEIIHLEPYDKAHVMVVAIMGKNTAI